MTRKAKVFLAIGLYFLITIAMVVIVGSSGKNEEFQPQNEFLLDPWISIQLGPADMSINKAVLYLFLAATATIGAMSYIANRMQREPNKVQMMVELAYDLTRNNIAGNIPEQKLAKKWFPYLAALFFFIWFSNMLGYIPLPTNTEHKIDVFGLEIPSFAIYAATANISIPLVLAIISVISYHVEGIRAKGVFKYFASWLPPGLESMNIFGRAAIFTIEVISHMVRVISLAVRLFANSLAGHLLILFMAGGLAVLL
ncbi:MAG: F0F1 ATP synthase subunit A, partial [Solirubrobacterales bacterium]